jgi:hypothetical protein
MRRSKYTPINFRLRPIAEWVSTSSSTISQSRRRRRDPAPDRRRRGRGHRSAWHAADVRKRAARPPSRRHALQLWRLLEQAQDPVRGVRRGPGRLEIRNARHLVQRGLARVRTERYRRLSPVFDPVSHRLRGKRVFRGDQKFGFGQSAAHELLRRNGRFEALRAKRQQVSSTMVARGSRVDSAPGSGSGRAYACCGFHQPPFPTTSKGTQLWCSGGHPAEDVARCPLRGVFVNAAVVCDPPDPAVEIGAERFLDPPDDVLGPRSSR